MSNVIQFPKMQNAMTVEELRQKLAPLDGTLPVFVEVTFNDGDDFEGAPLVSANVEARCDEIDTLYLHGR